MQTFKRFNIFLFVILLLIPLKSMGMFELDFDFGYDRQIYGVNRQNSVVSRNYSGGFSSYLFDLTALDFNISNSQDITSENDRFSTGVIGYEVVAHQNRVKTNVYGVGIKQMLAGRGAFIVPVISVGYAREFVTSSGDLTVENTSTLERSVYNLKETKQRYNSVFGAFSLQLKLTERFSLKGTVKTIFPAFKFSKARDNVKYSAGMTWFF